MQQRYRFNVNSDCLECSQPDSTWTLECCPTTALVLRDLSWISSFSSWFAVQDYEYKKFSAGYVCNPWRGFITFCDLYHCRCWLVLYTGLHSPSSYMPITMIYVMALWHITLLSSEAATCIQSLLPWPCCLEGQNVWKTRDINHHLKIVVFWLSSAYVQTDWRSLAF